MKDTFEYWRLAQPFLGYTVRGGGVFPKRRDIRPDRAWPCWGPAADAISRKISKHRQSR